jgi:hypothetical protein
LDNFGGGNDYIPVPAQFKGIGLTEKNLSGIIKRRCKVFISGVRKTNPAFIRVFGVNLYIRSKK